MSVEFQGNKIRIAGNRSEECSEEGIEALRTNLVQQVETLLTLIDQFPDDKHVHVSLELTADVQMGTDADRNNYILQQCLKVPYFENRIQEVLSYLLLHGPLNPISKDELSEFLSLTRKGRKLSDVTVVGLVKQLAYCLRQGSGYAVHGNENAGWWIGHEALEA